MTSPSNLPGWPKKLQALKDDDKPKKKGGK
jgi:hypothetical protein